MSYIVERLRGTRPGRDMGHGFSELVEPSALELEAADEIERLRSIREWRDISTAPKDGTRILVYLKSKSTIIIRSDDLKHPLAVYLYPPSHPTHWQPLPLPPPPEKENTDALLKARTQGE